MHASPHWQFQVYVIDLKLKSVSDASKVLAALQIDMESKQKFN